MIKKTSNSTGEPNDNGGQDCVRVYPDQQQIDDYNCDRDHYGLCQIKRFDCWVFKLKIKLKYISIVVCFVLVRLSNFVAKWLSICLSYSLKKTFVMKRKLEYVKKIYKVMLLY